MRLNDNYFLSTSIGLLISATFFYFISCSNSNEKVAFYTIELPVNWELNSGEQEQSPFDSYLLYYFDADCSICIAKLLRLKDLITNEHDFRNTGLILIGHTANEMTINYNLKKFNIKDKVHIEHNEEFISLNEDALIMNEILLLDSNLNMLLKGDPFKEIKRFKRALR